MAYKPLTAPTLTQTTSTKTNTGSPGGINLLDAPELQSGNNVINVENYNLNANGNLESRKGAIEFLSSIVGKPVRMFEKMSSNIWVFSAGNTVYYFNESLATITTVGSYGEATDTDFVGWVSGDYLFFTNGTGKIQYVTFDYETVNTSGINLVPQSGDYVASLASHTIQIFADEGGGEYQVNTYEAAYVDYFVVVQGSDITNPSTWVGEITDYNDYGGGDERITISTIRGINTLVGTETFDVYQKVYDGDTDNDELKILYTNTSLFSTESAEFLPAITTELGAVYKVSYTWSGNSSDANVYIQGFNDSMSNSGMADTSPVYFSTGTGNDVKISLNTAGASETKTFNLTSFEVAIRTEVLTSGELSSSPAGAKRLLVFSDGDGDRLYCGNILGDPTAIKYSALNQVKDLGEVPFQTWTSSNTPLLRTDAGGFTNSNLGELKDLGIQVNNGVGRAEVLALFENGKKTFHIDIDSLDISGVATQVQKIVSEERQDFGGERNPLLIQEGIFYTNESGVWQMLTLGQEVNISDILGEDFVESVDWTNCDIVNDTVRGNILVTCGLKTTGYNDLILAYNLKHKSWAKYTGLNIERFLKDAGTIYGTSSTETKVYKLFEGVTDNGTAISTEFKFEVPLRLKTIFSLEDFIAKGEFVGDEFEIIFDTYDVKGVLNTGVKRLYANLQELNSFSTLLTSLTRLIVTIKCTTTDQHKITYLLAGIKTIQENKFRKPYTGVTYITDEDGNKLTTEDGKLIIL